MFRDGEEVEFFTSDSEPQLWTNDVYSEMVETDSGQIAHAMYVGSCVMEDSRIYLNTNLGKKYHCVHTPYTGKGIEGVVWMKQLVHPKVNGGGFPKVRVIKTLPVAIPLKDIKSSNQQTQKNYCEFLGIEKIDDIPEGVEFVPSVRRAKKGRNEGNLFNIRRTIFQAVE